jgi:peptidoglycan/xylan/chitin deacetylase (PgdA/CDA1 family)
VIWIIVAAALLLVLILTLRTVLMPSEWVLDRAAKVYPGVVFRIDTDERAIALTIDDAPHPEVTPGLLDLLRNAGAHATLFVIGANAAQYPELVDSIRAGGHELANHLYTDRMSASLSDEEFVDELLRTDALIRPSGPPKWCRPGSGFITPRIIRLMNDNGYTPCLGSAYPVDLYTTVDMTVAQMLENVRPGAILVLHDGGAKRRDSIEVLSTLLTRLRSKGYQLKTLTELSRLGKPVLENPDQ